MPSTSKKRAPATARPDVPAQLLAALQTPIEPVRASLPYRVGLALVAVTLLILPLVYLGLIAAIGYGIYWHATNDAAIVETRHPRATLFGYVAPIIVGLLVLAFLLKPLLSRRRSTSIPVSLRREEEPLLFEFIARLCRAVGAPAPRRIDVSMDVNASAGFLGGWRGLLGRKLVLEFGLPLVACLDARQFAGILAHELGHFSQGSAMRLTYVVRSMNAWFARVVYFRDSWDWQLYRMSRRGGHYLIVLIAWATRALIWLTRRVLWCLMWIGHGVSSLMLRQMEFDADRRMCRVAGCEAFAEILRRLPPLNLAAGVAMNDLENAWREKRLCDDLPALIRSRQTQMPAELRTQIRKLEGERKTGWFDSHPCEADRITAARRQQAPGLFSINPPASVLFADFAALSRLATLVLYKQQIGRAFNPQQLVKTETMIEGNVQRQESHTAMDRYFRGLLDAVRPVFPRLATPIGGNRGAVGELLLELRTRLRNLEPAARSALTQYDSAVERAAILSATRELRTAGFRRSGFKDPSIDAMSDDALRAAEMGLKAQQRQARDTIEQALSVALERLTVAVSLAEPQAPPNAQTTDHESGAYDLVEEPSGGTRDAVFLALNSLRSSSGDAETLRQHVTALQLLLGRVRPTDNGKPLIDAVMWHSRKAADALRDLHQNLGRGPYPYSDAGDRLPLSRYIVRDMPPKERPRHVAAASADALKAYYALYMRLMADLAHRAQQAEMEAGLEALEDPVSA